MSADDWKKLVDVLGLALLGAAFFLGIASWRIGNIISRRDAANLVKMEERTALAEKATEEIRRSNIHLSVDVATAKESQQRVEIELNKQKERTALAEATVLKLQERFQPRHFNPTERAHLVEYFTKNPKGEIGVFWLENPESVNFAGQIMDILKESGWTLKAFGPFFTTGHAPVGLTIEIKDPTKAPLRAKSIIDGFNLVGISIQGIRNHEEQDDAVILRVGSKE